MHILMGTACSSYRVKIVLTQKRLIIKELPLFSIILFYFRFGQHDNNKNFIKLFLMAHSKCLPSFKTLVAQIMKTAHVINYFIQESALITSSILLFYSYYADICKISNIWNFLENFTLNSNILRTAWPISVIHISIFSIFTDLSYETNL